MPTDLDRTLEVGHRPPMLGQRAACFDGAFDRAHTRATVALRAATVTRRSNSIGSADIVIAVPVQNEIDRIDACMLALSNQCGHSLNIEALFLVNNSVDGTAERLCRQLDALPIAATVIDVDLPAAERSAGRARWLANHAALDLMHVDCGVLFMTDADSRVPPEWVARYTHLLKNGWDAVAGSVNISPDDCDQIVPSLDQRNNLEGQYTVLIDELESLIDPVPHDPWPRHFNASGANLAVNVRAIRRLPDFPSMTCGEDRALVRAMEALDMKVRHDTLTAAHTSGRLFGRAAGGMADTLRHRTHVPDSLCDERLECADRAYLRAWLRATWRRLRGKPNPAPMESLAVELGIPFAVVAAAADVDTFGASWHMLEDASPRLTRRPIAPAHLPLEIQRATELLQMVRRGVRPAWHDPQAEMSA